MAATIFPLYDLVRHVAGEAVEVVLLVPPGASPHTFSPRPQTIRALTGCRTIFAIGHGLDNWAASLARDAGVPSVITVDKGLVLRPWQPAGEAAAEAAAAHRHDEVDPHYWLDLANAQVMVRTIAEALARLWPAAQAQFQQQAAAYAQQLQAADAAIRQQLASLPRREIATLHMAFGYFAAAYGLRIVATFEPVPGQEPTPRHVEAFLRRLRAHNLRVVFVEPQLVVTPLQALARDAGLELRLLDPLGGVAGRDSYLAMMRFNAEQIAAALRE
ncbi:MAG: periplasmic divalent manganese/zinc-binding lipoprotein [Candidatus Tectimicrobiota bacterium]|nr:MAG: periplasmic divalent manganese/zinc-binding lipoprotein [Candidatus Tectomicrobia bacterium]